MDIRGAISSLTKPFRPPAGYTPALQEKAAAPAPPAAPAPAQLGGVNMNAMQRREKAAGLKDGGMPGRDGRPRGRISRLVEGPGTTTSDSIPVNLSRKEYVLPADTTAAVGVENLDALVDATHTPVRRRGPISGMVNGGPVDDPNAPLAAAPATAPGAGGYQGYQADLDARNAATSASSFVNREKGLGPYAPPPPAMPAAAPPPPVGYEAELGQRNAGVKSIFPQPALPSMAARRRPISSMANGGEVEREAARQALIAQIPASAPTPVPAVPAAVPTAAAAVPAPNTAVAGGPGAAPMAQPAAEMPQQGAVTQASGPISGIVKVTRDPATGARTFSGTNVSGDVTYAGDSSFKPSGAGVSVVPGGARDRGGAITALFRGGAVGALSAARQAAAARGDWAGIKDSYAAQGQGFSSPQTTAPDPRALLAEQFKSITDRGGQISPGGAAVITRLAESDATRDLGQARITAATAESARASQRDERNATLAGQREDRAATLDAKRLQLMDKQINGGAKAPEGYRFNTAGNLEHIPGGPADPATKPAGGKPLNEGQAKALLFGTRMQSSGSILDELAEKGVDSPGLIKQAAGDGKVGTLTNWTQSPEQQRVEQAQRDFINAALRRESGAVISDAEFDNARKQYFPQRNDDAETRAQKKAARDLATRGILAEVPDADQRVAAIRQQQPARTVKRTGVLNGRKVIEYSDGSMAYAA